MGAHSYMAPRVHYYDGDKCRVTIGDWSALAAEVEIMPGGNHRIDTVASYPVRRRLGLPGYELEESPWSKGDVVIGSDVWIGRGARILGGVTIGHGAVVAAWSTVTKDIAPYGIAAGAPAKELRKRFGQSEIDALLRIAWWAWPATTIASRADDLASPDISRFIARYDSNAFKCTEDAA
jgi:acetyltransferase-like isoleucine patch superfamily enzyme